MRNEQFEELLKRACQIYLEAEYQKQEMPPHKFSKRHERIMMQMFKDMEKGIAIQAKNGKKMRRGKV